MAKSKPGRHESVIVIGLGRFGTAVAESLFRMGHEVLGVDQSAERVQLLAGHLTHVVQADTTSVEALKQLEATSFDRAVVAIGSDLEASILTVLGLVELGVPKVWAKATHERHGKILEMTGAHHVVYPEAQMGERVAHMVSGKMIDYMQFDDDFAIVKTRAPAEIAGLTLGQSDVRKKFGITVVGVKRPKQDFTYARPETVVECDDLLIISGRIDLVEKFAAIT